MVALSTVGTVLGVVAALLGLVAIGALIWAKFRTDADERTLLLWKGEAEAQKARADRLELMIAELTRRVETLEQENRVLRSVNDYRDEIGLLRTEVSAAIGALPCQLVAKEK